MVTVNTSWGVPMLDDLWQAIDWALIHANSEPAIKHVVRDDLQHAMRAVVAKFKELEATIRRIQQAVQPAIDHQEAQFDQVWAVVAELEHS